METSLQTSMCKGLRACGLRKEEVHEILNVIQKWYDNNGPEWTNDRIKALKGWYETVLAGAPVCPPWFRHSRSGMPVGIFGRLFRSPNPARALAALSVNTVFINRGERPSPSQAEKFFHALKGNGLKDGVSAARAICARGSLTARLKPSKADGLVERNLDPANMMPPTLRDMTKHIPVADASRCIGSSTKQERAEALRQSWESLPDCTLDFLDGIELGEWIPEPESDNEFGQLMFGSLAEFVGRIACLQQPALKARWIGNPNRVSQSLMRPLANVWRYLDDRDPCTCTTDQESGVRWVQNQLQRGVTLAGTDMTSASDLLSLEGALELIRLQYFPDLENYRKFLYESHVDHFRNVSRSSWRLPRQYGLGESVQWEQGWCLGTAPSFPLLSLVNSSLARAACREAGIDDQSYRVIGDDMIIDARAASEYANNVHALGGEVNLTKTLTSDRVAEFAGRIILPSRVLRKTYRFRDPGDDGFMSYVSDLGPQALGLLRPRQRAMFEAYKYVPGIALDGPWSTDSFGEPLDKRLGWALTRSGLSFEARDLPDEDLTTVEASYLYASLTPPGRPLSIGGPQRTGEAPMSTVTDYLSVSVDDSPRKDVGDPRHMDQGGKTTLQRLEDASSSPTYTPYEVWSSGDSGLSEDDLDSSSSDPAGSLPPPRASSSPTLDELVPSLVSACEITNRQHHHRKSQGGPDHSAR